MKWVVADIGLAGSKSISFLYFGRRFAGQVVCRDCRAGKVGRVGSDDHL